MTCQPYNRCAAARTCHCVCLGSRGNCRTDDTAIGRATACSSQLNPIIAATSRQRRSHNAENPSLDFGSFAVCCIKWRMAVCGERAVAVRLKHPCGYGVSVVLMAVTTVLRKSPTPQCRVDLGHDRLSRCEIPSVERPEVNPTSTVEPASLRGRGVRYPRFRNARSI